MADPIGMTSLINTATALALLLPLWIGCSGDGKVPVSGTVTWNGEAVIEGNIIFTAVDPAIGPDASDIIDGRFAFRSTPGEKRVEIFADRAVGKVDAVMNTQRREQYIPTRYNEETELTVNVIAGGDNQFNLALQEKKGDEKAGGRVSQSWNE